MTVTNVTCGMSPHGESPRPLDPDALDHFIQRISQCRTLEGLDRLTTLIWRAYEGAPETLVQLRTQINTQRALLERSGSNNQLEIRRLIERWATAVHAGDLATVTEDHADDIVMFDVPPPYEGVRGIDEYQSVWPPFFDWQRKGAVFDIDSLEICAGDDVAYAFALLRCGTPDELAANPASRLRLTLGLRKHSGRWVVAHEHHSFPYASDKA